MRAPRKLPAARLGPLSFSQRDRLGKSDGSGALDFGPVAEIVAPEVALAQSAAATRAAAEGAKGSIINVPVPWYVG
jgi:hypothetical protein